MSKLRQANDYGGGTRDVFHRLLCEELQGTTQRAEGPVGRSVEEQWSVVRSSLCKTSENALGLEVKKCPDWFKECSSVLQPLFEERNWQYTRWLNTGRESD